VAVKCNQKHIVRLLFDHRFLPWAKVDPKETRTPEEVLYDLATANSVMVDQMLDVLFEAAIHHELYGDEIKLDWLFRLVRREWEEKEQFGSILQTLYKPPNGTLLQMAVKGGHEHYIRLLLNYGDTKRGRVDPDFAPEDLSPCEMALKKAEDGLKTKDLQILNVFAEVRDMKMENKLRYIRLVVKSGSKEWISFDGFKKQLSSLSAAELNDAEIPMEGTDVKHLQFLASQSNPIAMEVLRLLLEKGLDPLAVSEGFPYSAVEIAAAHGNAEAFNQLTVYSEIESSKTKLGQLWIWASGTEAMPSNEFEEILQSIPLDEVNSHSIKRTANDKGKNILQFLASNGKTAFVSLLLQHGADPEAVTEENQDTPLHCAWLNHHEATT